MKGYKGFSPGLICRGKQYSENTVFEEDHAAICSSGMHFCEDPFEVLNHYPLVNDKGQMNDFAEVEALDEAKTNDGKKFCTKKLKIGAKLSFCGFVNACVNFLFEKAEFDKLKNEAKKSASGDASQLAASGDASKLAALGYASTVECSGEYSVICCAGHGSKAKARKGCWITLAEWDYNPENKHSVPVCVKTKLVDGARIKEDTFYTLKDGKFVEAD